MNKEHWINKKISLWKIEQLTKEAREILNPCLPGLRDRDEDREKRAEQKLEEAYELAATTGLLRCIGVAP